MKEFRHRALSEFFRRKSRRFAQGSIDSFDGPIEIEDALGRAAQAKKGIQGGFSAPALGNIDGYY
jgi:hypothetical protein